ncbi:MAG: twin-arginine translocase subunit TatC [Deltaproteobacteria bacterium]|nr:twin-arginine translocase subunit TatC [Deltaproteobacteria bacterium]
MNELEGKKSDEQEFTLVEHLKDLRFRVVRAMIGIVIVAVITFFIAPGLLDLARLPLDVGLKRAMEFLPNADDNVRFVVLAPAEYFLSKLKVTFVAAIFISSPWISYQLWAFVAPGLYFHERRWAMSFVWAGAFFFCAGGYFAYELVFPGIFEFFITDAVKDKVDMTLSIAEYLSMVMKLLLAFGVAFQAPVIVFVLIIAGIVKPDTLAGFRPYIIVGGFILGAALTPPDVVSQAMLALPLMALFELGLIAGRIALKMGGAQLSKEKRAEARAKADDDKS